MGTVLDSLTVTDLTVLGDFSVTYPEQVTPARPHVPDSEAKTVAQLVADHNALLAALRRAGVLAEVEV